MVTLDEVLRNANNAVSMAVNAVSALISISILLSLMVCILKKFIVIVNIWFLTFIQGMHANFIEVTHKDLKELEASEVTTVSFF